MADGKSSVKRIKVESDTKVYTEALEWTASFFENELDSRRSPRLRPNIREWRLQRIHTIRALKKFKEKLDTVCVTPNSEGNSTGNGNTANSLIGTVTSCFTQTFNPWITTIKDGLTSIPYATAIGNGLTSNSLTTNIGGLLKFTGTCISAISKTPPETHVSEKCLREIEEDLEEDQTLTQPLAKWLKHSIELDANVRKIFGVSLISRSFNNVIKIYHDVLKLSESGKCFNDIITHLEHENKTIYIDNDVKILQLEKFYQCLSAFPKLSDRISHIFDTFSAQPEDVQVFVNGVRVYHSIMGTSSSTAVPTTGEVFIFQAINLAIEVISLINGASITRHGTSKYSDALEHLTISLEWESEQMENLEF